MNNYNVIPIELRKHVAFICSRVTYDPRSGKVFYKVRDFGTSSTPRQKQWNTRFAGKETGYDNGEYFKVSFANKSFYVHQIAFACQAGYIPIEVDHWDKNKRNNKWTNLRDANRQRNSTNIFKRKSNTSGLKGVSWAKSNNCWRMDIGYKKVKYYSYHKTKKEAYEAYKKKSAELHGEFGCNE